MQRLSAPIFTFGGNQPLPTADAHTRTHLPQGQYAMTGPGVVPESGNLPVRGDLAHIRLAGLYFVPHYAVPMPHVPVAGGARLNRTADKAGEALATLAAGDVFNVLDIAGGWAWGQVGEDGPVGYIAMSELESVAP